MGDEQIIQCPECGSTNVFDLDTCYECDEEDCCYQWDKPKEEIIRHAIIKDANNQWVEDFKVSSQENAKKEILNILNDWNISLRSHEVPRELVSISVMRDKAIFFHDICDEPEQEMRMYILNPLKAKGILFDKIKRVEVPPFDEKFDILFFDWGGMSMGNTLLENFCNEITELAKDNPSRWFVMVSTFTSAAMKDAMVHDGELVQLPNVYLDINEFANAYNKTN